ncbi:Crp/Fnr family transcriptional regulator [Dendronalium sp. ChiSLP03b]|uniref:Crp/Fnr family transcriptional regulator n=1 Tax=Dendronalium sp. ChiSLP03b TaxID=3075381 RepID=UPI002AD3E4DD|nr:Crp/Fnr family transcriptional regulator [Dendronalium sp. ChiSLP03b]MDZ8205902.1 Crp/Fnr family transcriptional regulator [Dendronalium sp. ChiSLP03b]
MSIENNVPVLRENRLLSTLPTSEYKRLVPHLKLVQLSFEQILIEPEEPITHVYFPHKAMVSLITTMENGSSVEVAVVSNEGVVGISVILGTNTTTTRAIVQIPESAMQMRADVLKTEFHRGGILQSLLLRYIHALHTQVAQGVACNSLHTIEQRLARWLLVVSDRLQSDRLFLTQEFISQMLGVRRSSVSVAAKTLSNAGIMCYNRGNISIINREALEVASCECYRVLKNEYEQFLVKEFERNIR